MGARIGRPPRPAPRRGAAAAGHSPAADAVCHPGDGEGAAAPRAPAATRARRAASPAGVPPSNRRPVPRVQADIPLAAPPPFTLADIKNAIPASCFEKNAAKSFAYLAWDVAVVAGLAVAAFTVNAWWAWPLYWLAQGTMFWALFVVGHDW